MHPRFSSPSHGMARLDVHCAWHGVHIVLISGDASMIRLAAGCIKRLYEDDGFPTDVGYTYFDLPPRHDMDVEDIDAT